MSSIQQPPVANQGQPEDDERWREYLTGGDSVEARARRVLKLIPHGPRCRLCAAPFAGPGAPIMRLMGKGRSVKTPYWCNTCFDYLTKHHGGAEIESTFLFADIRGSTALAENMSSADFRALLDRFYDVAAHEVFEHDGYLDKFVGDELVAMFFPVLTGERHAARAIEAAHAVLRATGHTDGSEPWVPIGAGVHTGNAWVGAIGRGDRTELTAVGDVVNTTARLAAAAGAGEILVTTEAAQAAGLDGNLERRRLELKGKRQATDVVVLRPAEPA